MFLAHDGSRTVGRVAAVINEAHDQYHNEKAGFFGLFECMPDCPGAATALLDAAAAWVRERGAAFLRGPVNMSSNELDLGLLVEGFGASPIFHSAYNPPCYATFIEAAGLSKCKDLWPSTATAGPTPTRGYGRPSPAASAAAASPSVTPT